MGYSMVPVTAQGIEEQGFMALQKEQLAMRSEGLLPINIVLRRITVPTPPGQRVS